MYLDLQKIINQEQQHYNENDGKSIESALLTFILSNEFRYLIWELFRALLVLFLFRLLFATVQHCKTCLRNFLSANNFDVLLIIDELKKPQILDF